MREKVKKKEWEKHESSLEQNHVARKEKRKILTVLLGFKWQNLTTVSRVSQFGKQGLSLSPSEYFTGPVTMP